MVGTFLDLKNRRQRFYGPLLSIILIALSLMTAQYSYRAFQNLDEKHFEENYWRIEKVMQNQTSLLVSKLNEWGIWDDIYSYILNERPAFVKENITPPGMVMLGVRGIAILDDNGRVMLAEKLHDSDGVLSKVSWSKEELDLISKDSFLIRSSLNHEVLSFTRVNGIPVLMMATGVSNSEGTAPRKGRLVYYYEIDDKFVKSVESQVQLPTRFTATLDLPKGKLEKKYLVGDDGDVAVYDTKAFISVPVLSNDKTAVGYFTIEEKRSATLLGYSELAKTLIFQIIAAILVGIGLSYALTSVQFKSELGFVTRLKEITEQRERYVHSLLQAIPGSIYWFYQKNEKDEFSLEGCKQESDWRALADDRILVGRNLNDLGHIFTEEAMAYIKEFFHGTQITGQFEFVTTLRDRPIKSLLSLSKYDSPPKLMVVLNDITEKWSMEQQIENNRQIIVHNSRLSALGEMAGGIAHEINNPLAIIHLNVRSIRRKMNTQQNLEWLEKSLETIEKTVTRVTLIIRGLRNFSRDGNEDKFSPVLVSDVIEETLALCHERMKNNGIKVIVENEFPNLKIDCRGVQIGQVILNLINNAFDAIGTLHEQWIKIKVVRENERVQIRVIDSGSGIPQEVVDKMMNPFFTTKEVGKGTGLGLSISKGICESHGGNLAYGPTGKNTEFVVELPIKHEALNQEMAS